MRLLLVEADPAQRDAIADSLDRAGYDDVVSCGDVAHTHRLCIIERPDLVLLGLDDSGLSRAAMADLRPLTEAPENLPLLGIVAPSGPEIRRAAIALGVYDFIARPVDETELLLRVGNALEARRVRHQLNQRSATLAETLRERAGELDTAREGLSVLAAIADYHDDDTAQHADRVGACAAATAGALELPEPFVAMLRDAAPLHDIGKVGISRRILLKPGKLTPAEWVHMMRHVEIGAQILASARSPALRLAAQIARTHHERWDGNGYVAGLAGEEIPLAGRITALADVWDTLTRERPYRAAWDEDSALAEISAQAGAQFDPRVVEAFLGLDRDRLIQSAAAAGPVAV